VTPALAGGLVALSNFTTLRFISLVRLPVVTAVRGAGPPRSLRRKDDAPMKLWKPKLVGSSRPEGQPASVEQEVAKNAAPAPGSQLVPWMDNRKLSFTVLLLLTAGALYVAYIIFRPFLTAIFLAFVLSIAFTPLHQRIQRRIRGANAAALATTSVVMLCILIPCILISVKIVSEATSLYSSVAVQARSGGAWYQNLGGLPDALERTAERTGIPVAQLKSRVTARAQEVAAWLADMARWAARGVVQQIFTAILVFLVLFFLIRDQEEFRRGIFGMLPLPQGRVLELTTTVHETITANIYGMFAVGLVQGILTAIGFWLTGLRAPLLWGAMAMVLSFVPLLGPSLVWAPGAFVLVVQGEFGKALALVLWGAIVVSAADYIIRPKLAGGSVNVNRLLILLSFLGGVKAFGAIGIFVGPVILSLLVALFRILREEQGGQQATGKLAA
jgi:predicted PurR-regulated permease PerM